jgi:hypothetical protein
MKIKITHLLIVLLLSAGLFSFIQQDSDRPYEYLSITQDTDLLMISQPGVGFKTINVRSQKDNSYFDFRPALDQIALFEKEGWYLVENAAYSIGARQINYSLMRREKK